MCFCRRISVLGMTVLGLLLTSPSVYAVFEDISGTYSGNVTDTETNCVTYPAMNPVPGSSETNLVSITIDSFNTTTGAFSGFGQETFSDDGDSADIVFDGFVDSSGNVFSSSVLATDPGDGTQVSGTIDGSNFSDGKLTLVFSGADVPPSDGIVCQINITGTLLLTSGGNVFTPEVTPSSSVTDSVLFNTQIQGTVSDISGHIAGALSGIKFFGGPSVTDKQLKLKGATGLNAGDGVNIPYGIWGSYSYSDYENDLSSTAFEGTSHGFLGGIDFGIWDNTIFGVALGFDIGDIDTTFNGGNQETDTYTVAPYFGALLNDSWSVDFNVGYSRVDYDQFRTVGTTRVTSNPDADRWFGAFNLNGITFYENWILGGRIGALYASSVIDNYTESNGAAVAESRTKVGTVSIAGEAAYSYQEFEPFINLSYQKDFALRKISVTTGPQPTNDNDDILMKLGVRYFNKNGVTGNVEYSKRFLRDNFDEDRLSITLRADF